ncbi:MAG: lipocalin family protein [Ignavibacteria bacterium]|nr:lipocalin family protein [Ignavibacteria bacterium]
MLLHHKYSIVTMLILLPFLAACSGTYAPLTTVEKVDLQKYLGKWYEIASIPNSFQKGCNCTTAEYTIEDDFIRVINSCRKDSVTGALDKARGKAFVVEGSGNSRLLVQFFWPFKGHYYIIDLASDYSYAVVGSPSRKYLWILSRSPRIAPEIYNTICKNAEAKGFNISLLRKTIQDCNE